MLRLVEASGALLPALRADLPREDALLPIVAAPLVIVVAAVGTAPTAPQTVLAAA